MKCTKLIFLVIFFLSGFSCKKKDVSCDKVFQNFTNDTIYPSNYLMTYPGSWWEYQNGDKDSCTSWESTEIRVVSNDKGCAITSTEHYVLPRSTSFGLLMNNKNIISNSTNECTILYPIIGGENIGDQFFNYTTVWPPSSAMPGETRYSYFLEDHLTSYTVQGQTFQDVVVIRIEINGWEGGSNNVFVYNSYNYYAKEVGLIKSYVESVNTIYNLRELVNHYIAPH